MKKKTPTTSTGTSRREVDRILSLCFYTDRKTGVSSPETSVAEHFPSFFRVERNIDGIA